MLIDRPPITEGWHLVVMLVLGCVVVGLLHRNIKRRIALAHRRKPDAETP